MPPNLNMDLINDPRLYAIGAGILHINLKDPVTGLWTGYRDMGNATVIEPSNNDERFQKNESRTRYRARVANLLLRRNTDINFSLDEWSADNLALYFQGTRSAQAAQLGTAVTGEVITTAAILGRSYRLAKYGPISAVTITNTTTSTPLVLNTDYVISDTNVPIIRILLTATNVAPGDAISAAYTPTAYSGSAGVQIDIGTINVTQGALQFVGDAVNGPRLLFDYWLADFRPNGALPLITSGNENTPIGITASVNSDVTNHPSNPIGRILQLPA